MSNYSKTTDFEAKDSLPTGDSGKIIRGAEFETEFDAISTAIATKADTAGPTFTGTLTFETISDGTIGITAFVDEDNMASNSATLVPTQQSVKAYVDSQVTAQDLDFQADTGGALSIDLDSETLTFTGGTGIDTSGALNAVTFAIDSTVATLTGTQTLTNKTLTSPDVNTPDIDGGTIDGTVIGGATPAAVSATTVSATGNITVGGTVDGRDVAADGTKLDGIESGATADQTAAEIRTLVESATDSNVFTDADHTKLDGIEAGATADQTDAEIRAAVEAATDSNVFTDADHTKLDGIEALADVTDTTNVTAAGAVMDSELTNETAVKSLDQGVATTDTPTFAGLATSANVTFGDNDKAIFGAGSDLQLYHDGSTSFIDDVGDGNLHIRTDGASIKLRTSANADMIVAENGGAAKLYHAGSQKLATLSTGIDVTGTVTADGLTVDDSGEVATFGNTTANNYLSVIRTTTNPSTIQLGAFSNQGVIRYTASSGFKISDITSGEKRRFEISGGGDISFYEDTGTTAKLFWDASAESLGIGTSSPSNLLDVTGSVAGDYAAAFENTNSTNGYGVLAKTAHTGTSAFAFGAYGGANALMVVRGDGNVGIGTSSPANTIHVEKNVSGDWLGRFRNTNTTNGYGLLVYAGDDSSVQSFKVANHAGSGDYLVVRGDGNIGIGTSSPATALEVIGTDPNNNVSRVVNIKDDRGYAADVGGGISLLGKYNSSGGYSTFAHIIGAKTNGTDGDYSGYLAFKTRSASALPAERMRIDSSGNLLVGKTTTAFGTQGIRLEGSNGKIELTRNNNVAFAINRLTSDGDLAQFYKDGTLVGSIGTSGGALYIGDSDTNLLFDPGNDRLIPRGSAGGGRPGAIDLGGSGNEFKDLWLSGGVYVGGTATANKLDDYEEGTWTPTITGSTSGSATFTTNFANYTKVGELVRVSCYLSGANVSGLSGTSIRLGGLPFNAGNYFVPSIGYSNLFNFDEESISISGYTEAGNNYVILHKGSSNTAILSSEATGTSGTLMFNLVYKAG